MPIAKVAVEKYLNRPIEPITWLKSLKPLEVEEDLSYINPPYKFHVPMRLDQKVCFLACLTYPNILIRSDLGLGKTGVSLEVLTYFFSNKFLKRAFVFAPTNEVAEGWEDEIKKWGFELPYVRLEGGSSKRKWAKLAGFKRGVVIGTYGGIAAMCTQLVPKLDANGKPLKRKHRVIDDRLLLRLLSQVDAVIYDQSTKLGNTKSLTFEVCSEFSKDAKIRYGLAGRAFGRDPFILFSQFLLTDRGVALGRSAGMFREAFWRREVHTWGTDWVLRKRQQKQLGHLLTASSIGYTVDECVQLPPKVRLQKVYPFPDTNWRYYERLSDELLAAKGNYREVKNTFLRLRQISSGFIGFKDDDTGERAQLEFEMNPKLDGLMELIEELPDNVKFVIAHEFTWSGARICQELTKRGITHGWLWGGTKNWTPIKEAYNHDPNFRGLVLNHKKGAMGLNLQVGNYIFMYESPVSAIDRYELEGRIYRTGQTRKSFIIDIMVKDSIDQRILEFHDTGNDLHRALVERPEKLLKRRRNG